VLAVGAMGGRRRVLFHLASSRNENPSGLMLAWLSTALVVAAELDQNHAIYAIAPGGARRPLGRGWLVRCDCIDRVAFEEGRRLVLADPATGERWTYPRRIYRGATDESVYVPR
jgi:hypothetical protein